MKKIIPILIIAFLSMQSCKNSDDMLTPAEQLEIDIQLIENFITINNLDAQRTNSGLYYVITEAGRGEDHPGLQDKVKVHYKGYYIDSGAIFDETEADEPLTILLSNTIEGWKEGIQYFTKGAKGMLLIPSGMAYGPYPPMGVKANAVMVFEIELLDFFQ